ncbi:FtsQ-type POTRA domain-containing protein [Patescibacteria group bacterium]|nr:FtsQ-type POTRA domain-containing protein [Patescibacteria group bacterium]
MTKRRIKRRPHKIKAKKSLLKKPLFWRIVLIAILLAEIFYLVFFFDYFQIKNIVISGNEKAATSDIEALVSEKIKRPILFFNSQSIFLISPNAISNSIIDNFPNVGLVKVQRRLINTLVINIKERVPSVVFCDSEASEKCFFLDETGVAFEETADTVADFIVIRQSEKKEIVLGKEAAKKDIVDSIIKIKKTLKDNFNVDIKEANIASDERMNILTGEGWNVYFNVSSNMDLQITKLKLLLEKEIPQESRGALDYIDLRFERAYICDKSSPCSK